MSKDKSGPNPGIPDAEIIERFGGIRPMATKLGVAVTTVQGWKERGHIPPARLSQIVAAAAEHGVDLGLEEEPSKTESAAPPPQPEMKEENRKMEETEQPAPERKPAEAEKETPKAAPVPTSQPQTAAAAPKEKTGGNGAVWLALGGAVVLLGGAIVTAPMWQPRLYGAGAGGNTEFRLDGLASELGSLRDEAEGLRRDLTDRERSLSTRIDALEAGGGESGAAFAAQLAKIEAGAADLGAKLKNLQSGLSAADSRIGGLEAREGNVPDSVQAALNDADKALDDLNRSIKALEGGLASAGGNIGKLEGRVTELEVRPIQTGEKIAAMVLALGQVEDAMNSGKPYRAALERLEFLGREDPVVSASSAIAALSPWADYGIPDRLELRRQFVEIAPEIDRALSGVEEAGWVDGIWNRIGGLITIRRIDGEDMKPVARAEQAVEKGDLAGAAGAFEGLGSLGPRGNAWLNLVKNRIDAEREIGALYAELIEPLAGKDRQGEKAQ